jgi:hypothetical protein
MPNIIINGQNYDSPDDMPPQVRESYLKAMEVLKDSDGNGIPDILEGKSLKNNSGGPVQLNVMSGSKFVVGDKIYTNPDDLPQDARLKYDQAVARIGPLMSDTNGNGIPDIMENKTGFAQVQPEETHTSTMEVPSKISQEPPASVIQEENLNISARALIFLAGLILVGAIGLGIYILLPLLK